MAKMNGIELLALYGDDSSLGAFLPGLRRGFKKVYGKSPAAYAINKAKKIRFRKLYGDDSRVGFEDGIIAGEDSRLGAFLPGLGKFAKKVGKVTSPFTTAIAKSFLPSSLVDAAAGFDPTKKGTHPDVGAIVSALNPQPVVVPVPVNQPIGVKKIAIIAGAGIGAIVLLKVLTSRPQQPPPYRY